MEGEEEKKPIEEKKNLTDKLKKIPKGYFVLSTIVLAVILIIVLFTGFNLTGGVIGIQDAGQATLNFAESQGVSAEIVEIKDLGNIYEISLKVRGQTSMLHMTKDGKYFGSMNPLTNTERPQTQPTPTDLPKSDKPVVELFIMSHCPYGTQMEKGMIPVAELLGDKIDFELKFVYYAMHPTQGEVEEQLNQYCIQEEQNAKFLDYLKCFLGEGNGEVCLTSTGIDKAKLSSCASRVDSQFNVLKNLDDQASWLSGRFPKFDIYKADNEKYSVGGSPTLIINGADAKSGRDSASILNTVCAAFNTAPEECSTTLSSASPSPGFGYSTTTSNTAASAAQCS